MADNVTPFRRPPPRPVRPQQSGGIGLKTHRGKAILVHVLTLACFAVPFLIGGQLGRIVSLGIAIAAAVVAYSSRAEATPWAATHHEHVLRTLMIAYVILTVLSLPSFVVSRDFGDFWTAYSQVYFWINLAVLLWVLIRSGVGLVLAAMRKAIPHPRGLLL